MGIEPVRCHDAFDEAMGIEDQLALGQVELERLALIAALEQDLVGRPQRPEHRCEQGLRPVIRAPVDRCLRLLIG